MVWVIKIGKHFIIDYLCGLAMSGIKFDFGKLEFSNRKWSTETLQRRAGSFGANDWAGAGAHAGTQAQAKAREARRGIISPSPSSASASVSKPS
jgi:hypothetical protein